MKFTKYTPATDQYVIVYIVYAAEEEEPNNDFEWADIIPAEMVDAHRVKKGPEIYSDPEELFNPIAIR